MTFWSTMALIFQKNGLEHLWQLSLSAHSGVWNNDRKMHDLVSWRSGILIDRLRALDNPYPPGKDNSYSIWVHDTSWSEKYFYRFSRIYFPISSWQTELNHSCLGSTWHHFSRHFVMPIIKKFILLHHISSFLCRLLVPADNLNHNRQVQHRFSLMARNLVQTGQKPR